MNLSDRRNSRTEKTILTLRKFCIRVCWVDHSSLARKHPSLCHPNKITVFLRQYGISHYSNDSTWSRPSGIMVSDADCCAVGPEFGSRRRHGCSKMYSASRQRGTLNRRRARSPLVRLVKREEKRETLNTRRMYYLKIEVKQS
ncbi:hypothetical protein TNCV_2112901 [Trichonephila clavipes]|nr:hypothetical protein TNCV_2112901 [Trichonephila clavipes]